MPPGKGLAKRIEGVGAPSRSPWRDTNTAKCCGMLCNSASPYGPEIGWTIGMFIDLDVSCKILHPTLGAPAVECPAASHVPPGAGGSGHERAGGLGVWTALCGERTFGSGEAAKMVCVLRPVLGVELSSNEGAVMG